MASEASRQESEASIRLFEGNEVIFNPIKIKAVVRGCSVKKVLLEISRNSQENTCARVSFLIKVAGLGLDRYS